MLDQKRVFEILQENGTDFFTGVPDSYLNGFCTYALENFPDRNIIAANEGNAVAIAAGHYIASKKTPLVYMQNSGTGNAVNPLCSLADSGVYSIPLILLIGWRGQPGTGDWAQHKLQGEITEGLMTLLNIPHRILTDDIGDFEDAVKEAASYCRNKRKSFALISPKGVMAGEKRNNSDETYPLSREEAIEIILDTLPKDTVYCATTGRATRELFWLRDRRNESMDKDFLNVGSMGHASSVGLGIALEKPGRQVCVLDGDSAAIMHMGALTMVSKLNVKNYMHIVLNNGAHESVGGQPSAGHRIDFTKIASACGYETVRGPVTTKEELISAVKDLSQRGRASFIDCRIHRGLKGKLPEIKFSHRDAVDALMKELEK